MLTKCPECDLPVSDKAMTCPHCGYPLKKSSGRKISKKRRRLPNGFGQISELKGMNLRKPFRAMVTIGKTDKGRPICKLLQPEAYFETYNDAYMALIEYNKNPYDISPKITMNELFDRWIREYEQNVSENSADIIRSCWNYCSEIHSLPVKDIRINHIKYCMEEGYIEIAGHVRKISGPLRPRMKSMFNQMLDYAVQYEIVDKNYARMFNLTKAEKQKANEVNDPHFPFTDNEIRILWENINTTQYVDIILIQCYSGFRPEELRILETENINLAEGIMIGGVKTEAGKNRVVPIHSKIRPLIEKWYNEALSEDRKYLFEMNDETAIKIPLEEWKFKRRFDKIMKKLGLNTNHRPHDGRLYFVTKAKECGVDEYAIKYIVGHKIKDITEKVYTKRQIDWLKTEIEKIKG